MEIKMKHDTEVHALSQALHTYCDSPEITRWWLTCARHVKTFPVAKNMLLLLLKFNTDS